MDLVKKLEVAKRLAVEAGKRILEIYETDFEVEYKDDKSPLTEADKQANEIIVTTLAEEFPQYSILAEESEDDKSRLQNDWCWVIDPLDGTKEFLKRNDEFTVNIALTFKQRPVLGVIFVPVFNDLYFAIKEQGAFYQKDCVYEKIQVSDRTENLRLLISRSHPSENLKKLIEKNKAKIADEKPVGSSLKGCLIAKGESELYYRFWLTMEWDTCAMQCIVEEAGGILRQLDDTELLYNRKNSTNEKGFYILNHIKNKLK